MAGRVSPVTAGAAAGKPAPAPLPDAVRSDYLIFGFMKDMKLDVTRVPFGSVREALAV